MTTATETELRNQLTKFKNYLSADPSNTHLINEVADLHLKLGEFSEAHSLLSELLADNSDSPEALFKLATVELASGQPENAKQYLTAVKNMGVEAPAIDYNIAYANILMRDYAQAKIELEQLIDNNNSELPQAKLLLARTLHHLDSIQHGSELLVDYIDQNPNDAEAYGLLSIMSWDNGDSSAAEATAEKALLLNDQNLEARLTLGSIALEQQKPDPALAQFQRIVDKQPKNGRAWSGLGYAELLNLDTKKAEKCFIEAVKYMPNHIGTWHGLAWTQLLHDDLDSAEASFNKSMDLDRNFGDTHGGLGIIAVLRNQHDIAEEHIRRGLRLDSASMSSWLARSLLYNQKGDQKGSRKILRQLVAAPEVHGDQNFGQLTRQLMVRKFGEEAADVPTLDEVLNKNTAEESDD